MRSHPHLIACLLSLALCATPAMALAKQGPLPTQTKDASAGETSPLQASATEESLFGTYRTGSWVRLGGDNRYQTMSAIVSEGFTRSRHAVICTGTNFPDALCASSLAGVLEAPVILTASDSLTPEARTCLESLGVEEAYVLGGPAAVSDEVLVQLELMGISYSRIEGQTRYETSLETMRACFERGSGTDTAIVATGLNYPDSLSVGPWAYATSSPIVLVDEDGLLSREAVTEIRRHPQIRRIVVCGGSAVVDDAIADQLGDDLEVVRLGGETRYETSHEIADWEVGQGFSWRYPTVTTGRNYPDALAASSLAGRRQSPLLLSDSDDSPTFSQLFAKRGEIRWGYLLGGTAAVTTSNPIESFRPYRTTLDGVDISGWDEDIDISDLDCDFVIIKATEGTLLTDEDLLYNPWYAEWADEAERQGLLIGFYHYANGGDPVAEADDFYAAIAAYKGRAVACLDWEGDGNELYGTGTDVEWCRQFLDRISERFGGTPVLYTSKNEVLAYDWSELARDYPLWGAEYASDDVAVVGFDDDPWQSDRPWGAWGELPTIFQYGYATLTHGGGIDLLDANVYYGTRADWMRLLD